MITKELKPFKPNANPFIEDLCSMGTPISPNVILMHMNHRDQKLNGAYLLHIPTGQRISIEEEP